MAPAHLRACHSKAVARSAAGCLARSSSAALSHTAVTPAHEAARPNPLSRPIIPTSAYRWAPFGGKISTWATS